MECPEVKALAARIHHQLVNGIFDELVIVGGPYKTAVDERFCEFRKITKTLNSINKPIDITSVYSSGRQINIELRINDTCERFVYLSINMSSGNISNDSSASTIFQINYRSPFSSRICFNDLRKNIRIDIVDSDQLDDRIDILDDEFTLDFLIDTLNDHPDKYIIDAIANQNIIKGIGNAIRCDALYLAKINPLELIEEISHVEMKKLYAAIRFVALNMYKHYSTNNTTPPYYYVYKRAVTDDGVAINSYTLSRRVIYTTYCCE